MSTDDSDSERAPVLTEAEIIRGIEDKCYKAFKSYERDGHAGQIRSDQVKEVLKLIQMKMSEQEMFKIIAEVDPINTGWISYNLFKDKLCSREVARLMDNDEEELLDAFVAMGGEPDGEGCVDAQKLIKTIKEEFQMTIDIEALILEIDEDGSGEIEFDEFKALLTGEA